MTVPIIEGLTPASISNGIKHGSKLTMGLGFLTGGAVAASAAAKFGQYVHDGEVLVKRRLGNYDEPTFHTYYTFPPYVSTYTAEGENFRHGIKRRGLAITVPGLHKWVPLSTRFNPESPLKPQVVESEEGRQVRIGGVITWRVIDDDDAIYRALQTINNNRGTEIISQLNPLVIATAGRQLVATMAHKPIEEMKDLDAREAELRTRAGGPLYDLGVSLGAVILDSPYYPEADREAYAKVAAAKETASAIRELASAIRESGTSSQWEFGQPEERERIRLQEASRAAIGGVLAQTDQLVPEPPSRQSMPLQVVTSYRGFAECQP